MCDRERKNRQRRPPRFNYLFSRLQETCNRCISAIHHFTTKKGHKTHPALFWRPSSNAMKYVSGSADAGVIVISAVVSSRSLLVSRLSSSIRAGTATGAACARKKQYGVVVVFLKRPWHGPPKKRTQVNEGLLIDILNYKVYLFPLRNTQKLQYRTAARCSLFTVVCFQLTDTLTAQREGIYISLFQKCKQTGRNWCFWVFLSGKRYIF